MGNCGRAKMQELVPYSNEVFLYLCGDKKAPLTSYGFVT